MSQPVCSLRCSAAGCQHLADRLAALLLVRLAAALNASKSELERAKMDLELDFRTLK